MSLVERRPFAIWQNQGKFVLIDRDGEVVDQRGRGRLRRPAAGGRAGRAGSAATALLDALAAQPALKPRVVAAVRVGERRWNLRMNNGADVLLPEGAEAPALAKLMELQSTQALLDRPLAVVDMRLPDRLVVRPQAQPSAPARRTGGQKAHERHVPPAHCRQPMPPDEPPARGRAAPRAGRSACSTSAPPRSSA